MPTFVTNLPESDMPVTVEYEATEYVPARMYMNNGDPGHPAEGGEINICSVEVNLPGVTNFDLTEDLSQSVIDYLAEQADEHNQLMHEDSRY